MFLIAVSGRRIRRPDYPDCEKRLDCGANPHDIFSYGIREN